MAPGAPLIAVSFVSPGLLYGFLALAVPILIHLLFKARKQTVIFSWIRFIRESVVRRSSRLRFQELLLLLLRLAALALIVLAFARPVNTPPPEEHPAGPLDLVLVVDDSFSMSAVEAGAARFERARRAALDRLARLGRADRAALLKTTAPVDVHRFTEDLAALRAALQALRPSAASAPFALSLRRAVSLVAESTASRRGIVFISDFQRVTWPGAPEAARDLPAGAFLEPVAVGDGPLDNFAVADVKPPPWGWRRGEKVRLQASVANFGLQPGRDVSVEACAGERVLAQRTVDIPPGEVRPVLLEFEAAEEEIAGRVRLVVRDPIAVDDARWFRLAPSDPIRILCVENEIADVPYAQATYFLRTALNPATRLHGDPRLAEARLAAAADLDAAALAGVHVLILANVAGVTDAQAAAIETFVRGGGGLLVFCGDLVEPAVYDVRLYRNGAGPLPARIGGPLKRAAGERPWSLRRPDAAHPVFDVFPRAQADLHPSRFDQIEFATAVAEGAVVLAAFDDGAPAMLSRELGKGRCVLVLTSADASWTDLPKRGEVFVPLVHQLVRYLAARDPAAEPLALGVDEPLPLPAGPPPSAGLALQGPEGKARPLSPDEIASRRSRPAGAPGIYTLQQPDGRVLRRYAANVPSVESDPAPITPSERERIARAPGRKPDLASAESRLAVPAPADRLTWRSLLIAALALMLLETWLAGRLTA